MLPLMLMTIMAKWTPNLKRIKGGGVTTLAIKLTFIGDKKLCKSEVEPRDNRQNFLGLI